jgi:hypothetical protein
MNKTIELSTSERVILLMGLFARERDINISIADAKKYGLAHLDKLQLQLQECLDLQNRIG